MPIFATNNFCHLCRDPCPSWASGGKHERGSGVRTWRVTERTHREKCHHWKCYVTPGLSAMEPKHIAFVTSMAPEARGKTLLFSYWSSKQAIPDPYRKSHDVYEYVFQQLELGAQRWAQHLV